MSLTIPSVTTARLVLEPLAPAHSIGMFALWSEPEVCRYSGPAHDLDGQPIPLPAGTPADSDRILAFFLAGAAEGTRFRWAMLIQETGAFVGAVGFNHLGACAELAWHQRPEFWGHGLMTEAGRAALDWLLTDGRAAEVEAFIDPANTASVRLACRLGFTPTGEVSDGAERYLSRSGDPAARRSKRSRRAR